MPELNKKDIITKPEIIDDEKKPIVYKLTLNKQGTSKILWKDIQMEFNKKYGNKKAI